MESSTLSRRFRSACGAGYLGNFNNGKPRYLCHHRNTRRQKDGRDCGCPAIPAWEVDAAVWESVAEILADPDRLLTAAREELRRRGMAQSEEKLRRELRSVDKRLNQAREALGRLVRYHAEKATLDEATFEAAARPLHEEVADLEHQRDRLATALPGPRLQADQDAIKKVASEILGRLDELSFEEKQRLMALLDVQVRLQPDGHVTASMAVTAPDEGSHAKVLNRTSFR